MSSAAPTPEDFVGTPMLAQKKKVVEALECLNHEGYADLDISQDNLASYAERDIPVVIEWRRTNEEVHDPVPAGATAVHEIPGEHGIRTRKYTFVVHGLTGTEYATAKMSTIKSVALQHLTDKGGMLGIGRSELPVSIYDNVSADPASPGDLEVIRPRLEELLGLIPLALKVHEENSKRKRGSDSDDLPELVTPPPAKQNQGTLPSVAVVARHILATPGNPDDPENSSMSIMAKERLTSGLGDGINYIDLINIGNIINILHHGLPSSILILITALPSVY
ncbi:hypothetical protein B0H17DRAFT_1212112 [Mycena rosella]|uniref:Uncharacterized protein n=1 Tax=Mycena rosella TaxID=1033263 RepID=A0AAD7CSG0_MYCRO|nr:hypothetical protein B0H17DRAFT_1212112 [Mycena rosella]